MLAELRNVSKTYPATARAVAALVEMSLALEAGEFVAICGPSGCGKSTLLLTLGGLLRPDTGTVLVNETDVYALPPNERARFRAQNIGFVFQQFHLIPYLNVLDNVLTARLGLADEDPRAARQRAEQLIDQFGLADRALHRAAQLSTGERQRTALARALLNQPRLLLADEPTGNLDPHNAETVLGLLKEFTGQGGVVLLVTHDASAAERADRILRMDRGCLVT